MAKVSPRDLAEARAIMLAFAQRTGLGPGASAKRRYLWTDAFAVCTFFSLQETAPDESFGAIAVRLIDDVHQVLGRHRPDDSRSGWISRLNDAEGGRHPTAGGLRIGKRLPERAAWEPQDPQQEWDRDGQYFHYLTKWMHALERAAVVTADATYWRWAVELAQAAHQSFVYKAADGTLRMYWKMSIDLSRPLVASMGHHDPLDALASYAELDYCRAAHFAASEPPRLGEEIAAAAAMCVGRDWVTEDVLGIGGLLVDACRMIQLQANGAAIPAALPKQLLTDAATGLEFAADRYPFHASAEYRLAFRELGLAIGLRAVEALRETVNAERYVLADELKIGIEVLLQYESLAERITNFWRNPDNRSNSTWNDHLDINAVMLATSLLPRQFLMV